MAYVQAMNSQSLQQHYRDVPTNANPPAQRRHTAKQRFVADLSQCLFDFVIQLLPTAEEMAVKEDVRKLLERLIRTIEPSSRLLSFGSTANGFSLRNSDMDLCCLIDSDERLSATDLVTMLGDLLERETKFHVKPLPHARIPIVKLSLDPSPGLPLGIACDIGFENRLALENTRLLMCYAMIDPTRVRTMVLFLKVWSKRRKINSPYKGTLSSYGYVLLVIYFLVHVKNPPVLPNLQQMPPLRPISKEDTHTNGYNIWFFDDIELLRQRWHSENNESVAELLIDFFRYYSRDFSYNTGVASIRGGLLKKDSKGWQNDLSGGRFHDTRERNRFCIEDPFEIDFNVARCVTKDGLYTIRGEFMRATRVLAARPDRAIIALAELCEERKDEDLISPPSYAAPRLSTLPPQKPYSVGSQSMRPKGSSAPERLSPPSKFFEQGPRQSVEQVSVRPPPEHMAPKRGKWTSPPPPEAPPADHTLFENQLGMGLELATASTDARERETAYNSSSSNSEVLTDECASDTAESDDVRSVQSFTESTTSSPSGSFRRPVWLTPDPSVLMTQGQSIPMFSKPNLGNRGRFSRFPEKATDGPVNDVLPSPRGEFSRRSSSGPPLSLKELSYSATTPIALNIPLPPSPESPINSPFAEPSTVFYQTAVTRSPRPTVLFPTPASHSPLLSQYRMPGFFPSNHPPFTAVNAPRSDTVTIDDSAGRSSAGPDTPKPTSHSRSFHHSHSHSHSTSTITVRTPPLHSSKLSQPINNGLTPASGEKQARPRSRSPLHAQKEFVSQTEGSTSPHASTSNGSSPTPSSTGYASSLSRSPSLSPSPPPTATLPKLKDDIPDDSPVPTSETIVASVNLDVSTPVVSGDVVHGGDTAPMESHSSHIRDS